MMAVETQWFEKAAMRPISRPLILVGCLALVASPVAGAGQPVAFITIAQGNQSGIITYTEGVVRTPHGWEDPWRKHAVAVKIATLPPAVEFSLNMGIGLVF